MSDIAMVSGETGQRLGRACERAPRRYDGEGLRSLYPVQRMPQHVVLAN